MGEVHDLARGLDVVLVGGGRLAVLHERAVHHHAGEAGTDRAHADGRRLAVILVHDHRDVRIGLDRGLDQVAQERLARVLTGARGALHDDRGVRLVGRFHDGAHLLEVVDVERRQSVAVLGGVVEQLTHRNEWHGRSSWRRERSADDAQCMVNSE
jgi:hypothetical protein